VLRCSAGAARIPCGAYLYDKIPFKRNRRRSAFILSSSFWFFFLMWYSRDRYAKLERQKERRKAVVHLVPVNKALTLPIFSVDW
jgi:hypothetical protein